jgi:hypothetical protein
MGSLGTRCVLSITACVFVLILGFAVQSFFGIYGCDAAEQR